MLKPKIKCQPEDFLVTEIATLPLQPRGPFGVYTLVKRGWNTTDALREIAKGLRVKTADLSYGGKKDRYGLTRQWITLRGPKRTFQAPHFHLEFMGYAAEPMGSAFIAGNQFEIAVRKLTRTEAQAALETVTVIQRHGLPNYFDDQRFGSHDAEQGFWVEKTLKQDFNAALKTYLTGIHPEYSKEEKARRRAFGEHWKQWRACRALAVTPFEKNTFDFLQQKSDGCLSALFTIPKDDCSMAVSAFQSYLWNETVRRTLAFWKMSAFTVYPGTTGEYWFPTGIPTQDREALRHVSVPTAAAKMDWQLSDAQRIYGDLLRERGLQPGSFGRFPLRHAFFKSSPRLIWLFPQDLNALMAEDELYPGKHKLQLSYTLPRGSYATMVVKRLFSEPQKIKKS